MIKVESGCNFFNGNKSRLCKLNFAEKFINLTKYPDVPSIIPLNIFCDESTSDGGDSNENIVSSLKKTYRGLKNCSKLYQNAKLALFKTFKETNLGTWVKSPADIDLFQICE